MAKSGSIKLPASLTIAESSRATGVSEKAVRHRVDRGQLRKVKGKDGLIRIPRADLERLGLLAGGSVTLEGVGEVGSLEPAALLDRVVEQAERIGKLEALTERSESLEGELAAERQAHDATRQQLFQIRAEAEAATAERSRRWWQRRKGGAPGEQAPERRYQGRG